MDDNAFSDSYNAFLAWSFFVFSSFILIVVFMNMLIAIMGNTFGEVQSIKEMNAISEQIALIQDHIWLVDIEKEFENMRYIILLTPDNTNLNTEWTVQDAVIDTQNLLMKKIIAQRTIQANNQESQDRQNRIMSKQIQTLVSQIKKQLKLK
jgi:hypothetical protein